jgi:AcrR family transcriptional regulator
VPVKPDPDRDDPLLPGLPASIAAAWGRRARPTRGPRPGLTLDGIVAAGIAVATEEGLGAVSMGRVARRLGAAPMSLYRYVAAKDELLALMVDAALGTPPEPRDPQEGWRAGLERWAWAYHDGLRRHPWILRVPISGPPVTPNQTRWLEDGLRSLRDTTLPEGHKLSVVLLLSGYVRNEATLAADIAAATASGTTDTPVMPSYRRVLEALIDDERFPAIRAAIASGALDDDDDMDAEFVFGLERVLDGVAALMTL